MATSKPATGGKLRILCLHGYQQNAEVFRSRIGSWRSGLKSRAEFVFVDAPYLEQGADAAAIAEDGGTAVGGRSWWHWTDTEPGMRPSIAASYTGWEASEESITKALQQHAPVHGLLGFSQGATAAALYLAHAPPGSVRCAVLVGGFLPRDPGHAAAIRRAAPATPTLLVYGARDERVPEERTRALGAALAPGAARWREHPGGHMVPTCSGDFKAELLRFLDEVLQEQPHKGGSGGGLALVAEVQGTA